MPKLVCYLLILRIGDGSLLLTNGECQEDKNGNLTGKRLGGSDTYLRTYVNIGTCVGFTSDTRTDGVTYTINKSTCFLGQFDGSQGICSLTTLRDGDDHIVLCHHRIAVTEFRSVLYFYWNTTIVFYHLLANETCVPRGTTSHDNDALSIEKLLTMVGNRA